MYVGEGNKSETYFYENSMSILTLNLSTNPELNVLLHKDVSYSMRKLKLGLIGGISMFLKGNSVLNNFEVFQYCPSVHNRK